MKAAVYLLRRRGGSAMFGQKGKTGRQRVWLRDYETPREMPQTLLLDWLCGVFLDDCKTFTEGRATKLTLLAVQSSATDIGHCSPRTRLAHERFVGRFTQTLIDSAYILWGERVKVVEVPLTRVRVDEALAVAREHRLSSSQGAGLRALALGMEAGFLAGEPRPWRDGGQPTALGVVLEDLRTELNL